MLFGTPFGFCFFSTLHAKSSIKPHSGPMNLRLRLHLPLVVPKHDATNVNTRPMTGIRVADQVREWHEGSSLVLDDSYVHEVWNDSDESRVLFLLDLWHPDVQLQEREKIVNMFEFARDKGWIGTKQ
jgi:aspartate beta-hydroxylase